jgi:predicted DNA-binding transcriptional regulator AlpA
MTDATLTRRIEQLTMAVQSMAAMVGTRLSRQQLCDRLGIHRNTLARRMTEPGFPLPGSDGKWLLSEVIEWERGR